MAVKSVRDAIVGHYQRQGRREIDVPEWGMKVYADPMNLREQAVFNARANGDVRLRLLAYVDIIILKAMDKSGNKLFGESDFPLLADQADPDIVKKLGEELLLTEDVEAAKKS